MRDLRILVYHSVDDRPGHPLSVPAGLFREQMTALKECGRRVVSLAEGISRLQDRTLPREGAVAVTFDDGYRDNCLNVWPILSAFGIPCTIFLATDFVAAGVAFPWERSSHLRSVAMSWKEARAMVGDLVEFGAHSCSHRDLTTLSPEECVAEMFESRRQVEERTGRPVSLFAYPSGRVSPAVAGAVASCGYVAAVTARPGTNRSEDDPFWLRRTFVSPKDTRWRFLRKLSGWLDRPQQGLRLFRHLIHPMGA